MEESGITRMQREAVTRSASEQIGCMGFWRLVWIVAFGVLIAQGIIGFLTTVARALINVQS
jgi:hypothetical protein